MKGKLTDQPLAELIREISSKGLSGTLRLKHERVQSAVYFNEGDLVFAASNLRTLRMRAYLEKLPSITPDVLKKQESKLPDLQLLSRFQSSRVISQEQVDALLTALVTDVLRVALLWDEGTWEFDERARFAENFQVELEIPNLLREAALRVPATVVSSRFLNPTEVFARSPRFSNISGLSSGESFILSRLDEPMTLQDLVAISGLRDREAHRMLYGLTLSGCITREYWHNAFRTDAAKVPFEKSEASPLFASRFDKSDEDVELEQFLNRVNQADDYYELLELPLKAETSEVKDAYYKLARRYHPDRFHLKSGTSLHSSLGTAFARITQAYETLMDQKARASYDAMQERTRAFESASASKVKPTVEDDSDFDPSEIGENPEHNYREGLTALQQGRINAAINHLAAAVRLMPGEARYRAHYGKALAASERLRRHAEAELQEAVRLDQRNPSYRIMLAELYIDLGFHRRAQTEIERALAIDPNSASANSLLRKVQKKQKTG